MMWVLEDAAAAGNTYLVKRDLRALRRPHTARPSVNLTQRSTAALERVNNFPTE